MTLLLSKMSGFCRTQNTQVISTLRNIKSKFSNRSIIIPKRDTTWKGPFHRKAGCIQITKGFTWMADAVPGSQSRRVLLYHYRHFRTSKPHNIIPPPIWVVLKPLAKVGSIVAGRFVRKTYQSLSPEKKNRFIQKYKEYFGKFTVLFCIAFIVNFNYHLVATPITNRKRYIAFTDDQLMKIVTEEAQELVETLKESIVPSTAYPHIYSQVRNVVGRIIAANQDLDFFKEQQWTVVIIKSKDLNAFVLPTGHIFISTGMLEFANTEDKIAVVLGHEMAHALLKHGCEKLGMAQLLDYVIIFFMAAIWAVMPSDGIALITQWFYHKVVHLLLNLPFSRKLETEADVVGLELMAKACYDVREAPNFWNLMYVETEKQRLHAEAASVPEWISTHPASEKRAITLDAMLPKALQTRASSHCYRLPRRDPRCEGKTLLELLEKAKQEKQLQQQATG